LSPAGACVTGLVDDPGAAHGECDDSVETADVVELRGQAADGHVDPRVVEGRLIRGEHDALSAHRKGPPVRARPHAVYLIGGEGSRHNPVGSQIRGDIEVSEV